MKHASDRWTKLLTYSDRIPTSSLATLLNNGCEEAAYSMEVMKSVATEATTVAMVLRH